MRLLAAQVAIGGAAIFARFALGGAGPIIVSALRLSIAAIVVLAIARGFTRLSARREVAFAVAGIALALHFAAWIGSLELTSVAISTLLVTTTPIWTEAFDCVRNRTWPTRAYAIALVSATCGIVAIAFSGRIQPAPIQGHALLGDAFALVGSFAIGAYLLIVRDAGAEYGKRLATRAIVSRTFAWAAIALAIAALVTHQAVPPLADTAAWGGIVAMAFISQLLGHTALNAALNDFTPSMIALSTLLEAPIAAIFAALIFHETLSLQAALGGALIIGSVALVLRGTPAAR